MTQQPPARPAPPPSPAYPPTAPIRVAKDERAVPTDAAADALLLQFLHDRDAECPRCGYNVRNLTKPVCPECHERLVLRVGIAKLRIGALIAAIIPGIFSGLCGLVLLTMIIVSTINTGRPAGGGAPLGVFGLDAFGLISGIAAFIIILRRAAFLKLAQEKQVIIAAIIWFIHITALLILLVVALS